MATTNFTDFVTPINADWCNDVNYTVYDVLGNGTNPPATPADVRDNIDVPQRNGTDATGNWPISITGDADNVSGVVDIPNGGTGQTTASAAFNAIKQTATDAVTGVVELATDAEAQAGTSTSVVLTPANMKAAQLQLQTAQNTTSGSQVTWAIPSVAKRITVMLNAVSSSGTGGVGVQIGTGASLTTSGYSFSLGSISGSSAATVTGTDVIAGVALAAAGNTLTGTIVIDKLSGNTWIAHGITFRSDSAIQYIYGIISLAGVLDIVGVVGRSGNTLDAGSANVSWE